MDHERSKLYANLIGPEAIVGRSASLDWLPPTWSWGTGVLAAAWWADEEESWRQPPRVRMMEKVPYHARPAVQQVSNRLLRWCESTNSELSWFVLLRVFPILCLRQLRRGGARHGATAAKEVNRRLQMFDSFEWNDLMREAMEDMARGRQARVVTGAKKLERVLAKAAALARDGYLSRASSALEGLDPCAPDEATFHTLQGLHPEPMGAPDVRAQGQAAPAVQLCPDSVAFAAHHSKRAAAGYLQPLHLKCIAADQHNLGPLRAVLGKAG